MRSAEGKGLSRREFVRRGAAALVVCRPGLAGAKGKIPIAVQLYSVRFECAKDLPGTIAKVAKAGYEGVEFAGYYDRPAAELRRMLDGNNLKCAGTHIPLDTLLGSEFDRTVEFNTTLGNKLLIVPGLPPERTASRQAWLDTAKLFDEIADRAKPHGMRVGYHNHQVEFKPLEGEMPWDTFFGHTKKDVVMQVDIGNALEGGGDPIPYLKKYPGRAASVHVKEYSKSNPKAYIGEGDVKWKEVFDLLEKSGGTDWYIVEYEVEGVPPLEAIGRCLQNLRRMGK